jgi:hypothetical protein
LWIKLFLKKEEKKRTLPTIVDEGADESRRADAQKGWPLITLIILVVMQSVTV